MKQWEISKFMPIHEENYEQYIEKQWTNFSQIGLLFDNKKLTKEVYFQVEKQYVNAVLFFMEELQIENMQVKYLIHYLYKHDPNIRDSNGFILGQCNLKKDCIKRFKQNSKKYGGFYSDIMIDLFYNIKEGQCLNIKQVQEVIKLALRNHIGLKITCNLNLEVEFGFDYYMFVSSNKECKNAIQKCIQNGLFVTEIYYFSFWEDN